MTDSSSKDRSCPCVRLDATMRHQLLRVSEDYRSLSIGNGKLVAEVPESELPRLLPVLLDIGWRLACPVSVDRQIAENALQDSEEEVRLFNPLLLVRKRNGRVVSGLRAPERHSLPLPGERPFPDGPRPPGGARPPQNRGGDRIALCRAAAAPGPGKRGQRCLGSCGEHPGPRGTVAAVQPLQEAAESSLFDLGLRRAARQAVAEIQSRLDGASPGQLSLAQAEAGQLSLASEAGQLSLAPQETEPAPDAPAVPQRPFETDAPQGSPPEAFRRQRE